MQNKHVPVSLIDELSDYNTFCKVYHRHRSGEPFPSGDALLEVVNLTRAILFPGYFGNSSIDMNTIKYHIGVNVECLVCILRDQFFSSFCFDSDDTPLEDLRAKSSDVVNAFIAKLPQMRQTLITDVEAAYYGDPAAKSFAEIILCYPAIKAISNYRIAHELLILGVPLIPRMISEMAHSETGIDIHPGATIGEYFTIDHGTGVVVGETAIIGNHVKLYQGVTLGAKSFELDESGNPIKNVLRHPIVEDNVIIYSNASILGRITIGEGAVIGGNVWVTSDVAKGAKVTQSKASK
ncbi:MAG TPA: serine acetyltransferase [Paludibacteraceae bacterium]|nr:serine acetyltransferase [Paludibacteraceae bacterium]